MQTRTVQNSLPAETEVWRLVDISYRRLAEARNKQLILLVGATGSGKSALINYLNGSEMEYAPLPDDPDGENFLQVKTGQLVYAEIGHDPGRSKTLHPQAITNVFSDSTVYLDLPGSSDNHLTDAEKLCASVALPLAIYEAQAIHSIIVVIDTRSFVSRGKVFNDFINLLGGLVDPSILLTTESATSPLLFVFTHVDTKKIKNVRQILSRIEKIQTARSEEVPIIIQRLITSLQEIAEKLHKTEELAATLEMINHLNQSPEHASQAYLAFFKAMEELLKTYKNDLSEKDATYYQAAQRHYDDLCDAHYELIAFSIILKYKDQPNNQFIIHGEEGDDKERLLAHIQRRDRCEPIHKNCFIFKGRAGKEWLQLDKLLQTTAEKGYAIKQTLAEYPQEVTALKKYRHFLKERYQKHIAMLYAIKNQRESDVDSMLGELKVLAADLEKYLYQELAGRKTDLDKTQ